MGRSDQNMKHIVLDLKTGVLATTNPIDTGITYAFTGSMLNIPLTAPQIIRMTLSIFRIKKKCAVHK